MRNIFSAIALALGLGNTAPAQAPTAQSVYDFMLNDIDGNPVSLCKYEGYIMVIVNVASKCGLTPQYKELQEDDEDGRETPVAKPDHADDVENPD